MAPWTKVEMESSITYTVALGTRRTLGPGQTSVSLLSLLTRGSDETNQTWVALWDKNKCAHTENNQRSNKCPFVRSDLKAAVCMCDNNGKTVTDFYQKTQMHMGGCEE